MSSELPSRLTPKRLRSLPATQAHTAFVALSPSDLTVRPLTSVIGRETDVAAACALLAERGARLLTLTGPGGVGKTRLALRIAEHAADAFAGGVVFIPLATITDPDLVLPTITRAIGLREDITRSPAALLIDYFRGKRLLLVLDNFEQVRPAANELASILAVCPGIAALVTSRALLHVSGEQRFPVAPLSLPPSPTAGFEGSGHSSLATIASAAAVQLFINRAQAVEPQYTLTVENAAVTAEICRRLDGLPLAIELAAARLKVLSAAELLARLSPSLPLLTGGPEDAPHRLRTMRHAIAWSYDLLTEDEAQLFRRLAIFVGGCTLAAAEQVARGETRGALSPLVLDLIDSLVDKSLLRRIESGGKSRYLMLETIHEFGLEQLEASGELPAISSRHAAWCVDLAEVAWREGWSSQGRGLANLEVEHPNLRGALGWMLAHGDVTAALHLAGLIAEFWMRHGHLSEGQAWLERSLAADDGEAKTARAEALVGLNMLQWHGGQLQRAEELLDEAMVVAQACGDASISAYVRLHQGYVALFRGDLDLAMARGEDVMASSALLQQGFGPNAPLWLLAKAALSANEEQQAARLFEHLEALSRAGGDEISLANARYGIAVLATRKGDAGAALAGFAEAAALCRGLGDRLHVSLCLDAIASTAVELSQLELAVEIFAAADALRAGVGAQHHTLDEARSGHEHAMAKASAALGEERTAAGWTAGARLTLDEILAKANMLAALASANSGSSHPDSLGLTTRERDILRLLSAGSSDKEIASALGISRRTVSWHITAIRSKLDAPSRTAAAAIAVRNGLV